MNETTEEQRTMVAANEEDYYNRAERRKMNRITKRLMRKYPNMSIQELAETAANEFRGTGIRV